MNAQAAPLAGWETFYVIVGSSGGALIGLQFVVMTLIANRPQRRQMGALSAFGTPTVVHLTGALLVSALMSVPWPSFWVLSVALGTCAVFGMAYSGVVIYRARRQTDYAPVWEDWLWYIALPCVAYTALALTSVFLPDETNVALFGVAAVALGLLLVGIHNAWDTVTHLVVSGSRED